MLFTRNLSLLPVGIPLPLYARLRAGAWRRVGALTRSDEGARATFEGAGRLASPAWSAAQAARLGAGDVIEFGAGDGAGGVTLIARGAITRAVLADSRASAGPAAHGQAQSAAATHQTQRQAPVSSSAVTDSGSLRATKST